MTLDDFVKQMSEDVERFKKMWEAGHKESAMKDQRPLSMEIGDWYDQFLIFQNTEPNDCDHEWVSARNKVVKSGEICTKCFMLRAEGA